MKTKILLNVLALIMCSICLNAQSISGYVFDAKDGEPIIGATVSCGSQRCFSPYNSKTYCHGSGKCPICGGDGYMEKRYDPLHNIRCSSCHGNGRCQTCLGTGQCKRCGGSGYI